MLVLSCTGCFESWEVVLCLSYICQLKSLSLAINWSVLVIECLVFTFRRCAHRAHYLEEIIYVGPIHNYISLKCNWLTLSTVYHISQLHLNRIPKFTSASFQSARHHYHSIHTLPSKAVKKAREELALEMGNSMSIGAEIERSHWTSVSPAKQGLKARRRNSLIELSIHRETFTTA